MKPSAAFMGVFLGMCAKVMFPDVESEMGLPLLIKTALPIGITGLLIAAYFSAIMSTADSFLFAYSFMVSGLFVPTLGAYFWHRSSATGALFSMLAGGTTTLMLEAKAIVLPSRIAETGISPTFFGILVSALVFFGLSLLFPDSRRIKKIGS